jgi:hypothetical protein
MTRIENAYVLPPEAAIVIRRLLPPVLALALGALLGVALERHVLRAPAGGAFLGHWEAEDRDRIRFYPDGTFDRAKWIYRFEVGKPVGAAVGEYLTVSGTFVETEPGTLVLASAGKEREIVSYVVSDAGLTIKNFAGEVKRYPQRVP